ncbi:ExbD/TolR family protein [Pelobacter seleniigenes]|uniref:ExbD/TolR family protein n=1 Tax=Pelobacter seleniigenes TaxID=407188 RepID=UPI0004A7364A|nr:biopolymer transporter ExbD [Pelobacter seleniigenes]
MIDIAGQRRGKRAQADLNMAPLIDMVFILLIFFLVTTSFVKETGVEVNRPSAASAVSQNKTNILLAITPQNRIYMDHREIDLRAVRANVERALAENPDGSVVVVADRDSNTGIAIQVMDGCRQAGARNVALAAQQPH